MRKALYDLGVNEVVQALEIIQELIQSGQTQRACKDDPCTMCETIEKQQEQRIVTLRDIFLGEEE